MSLTRTPTRSSADERFTVTSAAVRSLLRYAEKRGVQSSGLLLPFGLERAALDDVDLRISQGVYNGIFAEAARQTGDEWFGLRFAESADLDGFHVVAHLAARAATLGEALAQVSRFSRIVHDAGSFDVEEQSGEILIHPGCRGMLHDVPRHVAEFAAATVLVFARQMTESSLTPLRVEFRHPAPDDTSPLKKLFRVQPRFSRPETVLAFDASCAALPLASSQEGLAPLLERFARDVLERIGQEDDLVARVERAIAMSLEQKAPELDAVARQLGMSGRSLQRRLAEVETHFAEVVDSVRRACAARYVADRTLTLQEAGFLLGYSDQSNFQRAFRRWFGVSPGELRRQRNTEPRSHH